MQLSPDQYLNLVDQMTVLRMENQRFHKENKILADHVQRQNAKLQELSSTNHALVSPSNADSRVRAGFQKTNRNVSHIGKTADEYVQDFQNSIKSMQNNICQCISTNITEQLREVKKQFEEIRADIKPLKLAPETKSVESTQINNRQTEQNSYKVRPKKMQQAKDTPQQQQRQKDREQFYKKVKFLYSFWNKENGKEKKQPSLLELYNWVNKIIAQSENIAPRQQFNPIQAVKKARSQNKSNEISFKNLQISQKDKDKRSKIQKNKSQTGDRKEVEKYIQQYVNSGNSKQSKITKNKSNRKDQSYQSTKKLNFIEDQEQASLLQPKQGSIEPIKKEQAKIKKQDKRSSILKKKSIQIHKQAMAKLTQQNKQKKQSRPKKETKSESKSKIQVNESKIRQSKKELQKHDTIKKEKRQLKVKSSQKNIQNSRSLDIDSGKKGTNSIIPKNPSKLRILQSKTKISETGQREGRRKQESDKTRDKKTKQQSKKDPKKSKDPRQGSKSKIEEKKQPKFTSVKKELGSKQKIDDNKSKSNPKASSKQIKQSKKDQKHIKSKQDKNFLDSLPKARRNSQQINKNKQVPKKKDSLKK